MFTFPFVKKEFKILEESSADKVLFTGIPEYLLPYVVSTLSEELDMRVSVKVFRDLGSLNNYLSSEETLSSKVLLEKNCDFKVEPLIKLGYNRVKRVWEQGEVSIYGDVAVLWPYGSENVVRLSLLGDEVELISIVDAETRRKIKDVDCISLFENSTSTDDSYKDVVVYGADKKDLGYEILFLERIPIISDQDIQLRIPTIDFHLRQIPLSSYSAISSEALRHIITDLIKDKYEIYFIDKDRKRYDEWEGVGRDMSQFIRLSEEKLSHIPKGYIDEWNNEVILTRYEAFGEIDLSDPVLTRVMEENNKSLTEEIVDRRINTDEIFKKITPGDYIVHEDHGVGRFEGVVERKEGVFLKIQYSGKDRLFVPLVQSKKITKFIGAGRKPQLTSLNSGSWRRVRRKADEESERLAKELIKIYAIRQVSEQEITTDFINDEKVDSFIEDFEFQDTEDQVIATEEILRDIKSATPMDRLLIGDVGFGKTEVAMRAMFSVILRGQQVMFLAPTTVLVEQHRALLEERMSKFGVKISALSRFLKKNEREKVIQELNDGKIDLIVGTHSLFSDEVKLKDLGLIVIDEEQKFGVKQKELLKLKRLECHVLSMSATPIPRTLNMALSGIRDISVIKTAPLGRKPIINKYASFDWQLVNEAISKELDRKGQIYFLHNRVKNIEEYALKISNYFPDAVVEVAHGQLSPERLSSIIYKFGKREIDILVCTTIIENGIDMPNVNTLIIDRSEMFGLSQLYQIRGRVGRSDKQAYAYFFYNKLVGRSAERLDSLGEAERLGSGFVVASKDMEIRGVGEILGRKQSGSISAVGYGMFLSMLQEKIASLKSGLKILS